MAFNANFTGASVGADLLTEATTLFVDGTSIAAGDSREVYVVMRHKDAAPVVAAADEPTKTAWQARFTEDAAAPFSSGDEVFVVGIAILADCRPLVWEALLTIE